MRGDRGGGNGGGGDNGGIGSVVALFVRPLFEAMGEQNKVVQAGAAACLAKMVECAGGGGGVPVAAFQKLCPRICKLLGSPNFLAKAAILPVVASLSQVCKIGMMVMMMMPRCFVVVFSVCVCLSFEALLLLL